VRADCRPPRLPHLDLIDLREATGIQHEVVRLENRIRPGDRQVFCLSGGVRVLVDQAVEVGLAVTPPRCILRVPCSMNTKTYSRFSSMVSTWKKAGGEDPGGLGVQEPPPGGTRAARRRIDARGAQDLPDRGLRDRHARVSSVRRGSGGIPTADSPSPAGRQGRRCSGLSAGGPARCLLVSYFFAASLRCQASNVAGVTGKTSLQRVRGMSRASAASHARSAGS
jgi:hypothetical protein